jgi:hypothetical protein
MFETKVKYTEDFIVRTLENIIDHENICFCEFVNAYSDTLVLFFLLD